MRCMNRCCVIKRMDKALHKLLEKEFPNDKEFKISGITDNDEQVNIHISHITITLDFIRKIENLHYKIIAVWAQAHDAISLAVVPDESWFKEE